MFNREYKKSDKLETINQFFENFNQKELNVRPKEEWWLDEDNPPRAKGMWICKFDTFVCSNCYKKVRSMVNFCPACGSDMRGDKK